MEAFRVDSVASTNLKVILRTVNITITLKKNQWTLWELNPRPHAVKNAKRARYQLCQVPLGVIPCLVQNDQFGRVTLLGQSRLWMFASMMDVDPIDAEIYTTQQPRRRQARPVDDAHPFDLDAYIASYSGQSRPAPPQHRSHPDRSHRRRQTPRHHRRMPRHRPTGPQARLHPPLPSPRPVPRPGRPRRVRECRRAARGPGATPRRGRCGRGRRLDRGGVQEERRRTDETRGRAQVVHQQHDQGEHTGARDPLSCVCDATVVDGATDGA